MSGKRGRLFSPRYPKPTPPRSINCTWMITVPKGNFVKLRLTSIKLDVDCSPHSTFEIRDGQNSSKPMAEDVSAIGLTETGNRARKVSGTQAK